MSLGAVVGFCRSGLQAAKAGYESRRLFAAGRPLLLMLFLCGSANAADWVVVHTSPEGDQYYYDASKLAISGNEITYWKKVTFKTSYSYQGQQAVSALYRERIHCSDHTVKPLIHIVHALGGKVIEHLAVEMEATAIIPETIGDVFEQALCTLVKVKREEEPRKAPAEKESTEPAVPPKNYNESPPPPAGTL